MSEMDVDRILGAMNIAYWVNGFCCLVIGIALGRLYERRQPPAALSPSREDGK